LGDPRNFRAVFDFCFRYVSAHHKEIFPEGFQMDTYMPEFAKISEKLQDYFTVLTVLCVYNMFLICSFQNVVDALGNANQKFTGMRMLIILGQLQPQVVQMPLVQRALYLNENTGKLLHSTLLTFECLIVVIFNYKSWEWGVKKELLYDARDLAERRADNEADDAKRPLLGCTEDEDNPEML